MFRHQRRQKYLRKFRGGEGDTIWHETVQGGVVRWATGNTDAQEELSLSSAYGLRSRGEITSSSANGLRIAYGNYGFFIRNDGSSTYFMLTKSGDRLGTYNNLRPLIINDATGAVSMGHGLSVTGDIVSSTKVRAGSGKNSRSAAVIHPRRKPHSICGETQVVRWWLN